MATCVSFDDNDEHGLRYIRRQRDGALFHNNLSRWRKLGPFRLPQRTRRRHHISRILEANIRSDRLCPPALLQRGSSECPTNQPRFHTELSSPGYHSNPTLRVKDGGRMDGWAIKEMKMAQYSAAPTSLYCPESGSRGGGGHPTSERITREAKEEGAKCMRQ